MIEMVQGQRGLGLGLVDMGCFHSFDGVVEILLIERIEVVLAMVLVRRAYRRDCLRFWWILPVEYARLSSQ